MSARKSYCLELDSMISVHPNATAIITTHAGRRFVPTRLVFSDAIASCFVLHQFAVNRERRFPVGTALSGALFNPVNTIQVGPIEQSQEIAVTITNITDSPVRFRATLT